MSNKLRILNNFVKSGLYVHPQSKLCSSGQRALYNSVMDHEEKMRKIEFRKLQKEKDLDKLTKTEDSLPFSLRLLGHKPPSDETHDSDITEEVTTTSKPPKFPLDSRVKVADSIDNICLDENPISELDIIKLKDEYYKERKNWMLNYDNYDDTLLTEDAQSNDVSINYGTPIPRAPISDVPCGGCGAYLHCKDTSLPGYIPSEIFLNSDKPGSADLSSLICQRCYFLKNHNIALEVQVSQDDYPKILQTISSQKHGIIVLMVDMTDFPCSIWPGIADIFSHMPILIVGNKVDLLPKDSPNYLTYVKRKLLDNVKSFGFATSKLIDVTLISALTGYGVEKMISALQSTWMLKGNVYLVGCTNVGKSTLFNTLITSDFCKSQAEDLVQRATTSTWPGTTLNLLKFPIARANGVKMQMRKQRLEELTLLGRHEAEINKQMLRTTNEWKYGLLTGRVERTVRHHAYKLAEPVDSFSVTPSPQASGKLKLGFSRNNPISYEGKWCYDTPGVIQSDHILHLLTSEELSLTLPKGIIAPRCFCVNPGDSLFIAGLARLDYVEGNNWLRLTVFSSRELPISICKTEEAEDFYKKYLGTEYFKVPSGGEERLGKWPGLSNAKTFTVKTADEEFATKDVVLSNAGWISIAGKGGNSCQFTAWTPEKRGVHVREALLPQAVNLRGPRIRFTPAYKIHKYFDKS